MSINQRIKEIRKDIGLNQSDFGARIGLKSGAISKIEQDGNTVVEQNKRIICDKFHVSMHWLETGEGDKYTADAVSDIFDSMRDELNLSDVEENILPRLYRQAPLNSIWEGSGNVQCLDVLRALRREPEVRDALFAELYRARGEHPALDREIAWLNASLDDVATLETRSRLVVERAALALQAALLLQTDLQDHARAFCDSRLGGAHGLALGTLGADAPFAALIERAMPAL